MIGHIVTLLVDQVDVQATDGGHQLADRVVGVAVDGLPLTLKPGSPVAVDAAAGEAGWAVTFTVVAHELGQGDP